MWEQGYQLLAVDITIPPTTAAYGSTIPGGVGLIAAASGQFVAGTYNKPDTTTGPGGTLAIFGNGMEDTLQGDALVISKRVSHQPSDALTGGATDGPSNGPSRIGTLYADNAVIAWGNVPPRAPFGLINDNIGISAPVVDDSGIYTFTLNVANQDGSPHVFSDTTAVSIVATIEQSLSGSPRGAHCIEEPIPLLLQLLRLHLHSRSLRMI